MLWRQELTWLACALLGITAIVLIRHYKLPETVIFVVAGVVPIAAYLMLSGYPRRVKDHK
jgi:uncharacterized membrane protein YjjB (DUF3815 family)